MIAFAAALAAALGPAAPERATFSWPPRTIPDRHPGHAWLAPLMLNQRIADAIHVRMPCRPGPFLAVAGNVPTVLETARTRRIALTNSHPPRRAGALHITWSRRRSAVRIVVGSRELSEFTAPPAGACAVDLTIKGRTWAIRQGGGTSRTGNLADGVAVNGLISQVDLRSSHDLRVDVTPAIQDTHPTTRQTVLRLLSVLALGAGLLLLAGGRMIRLRSVRTGQRRLPQPTLPDAAVVVTLLAWWIFGPALYDDGWVMARQTNALHSGGFSNYYTNGAANLAFGTWLEWLQQHVVAHTTALVIQRIPSIVCLGALWLVCRAILTRLLGPLPRRGNIGWWSAFFTFGIGAVAFGITLRPEPMNALLVASALLCMMRFAARPTYAPLAGAVIFAGLAASEHPEGFVALAPILACLPLVVREARKRISIVPAGVWAVAISGAAWFVLLEFLDSDLQQRRADARDFELDQGHSYGITGEPQRYKWLWEETSVRREFGLLCILCVLAFLVFGRRRKFEERLPSISILIGLLLLAFVPSKWAYHFGTLIAPCAAAVGLEARELVRRGVARVAPSTATLVGVFFALVVVAWGPLSTTAWGPLDLRTVARGDVTVGGFLDLLWAVLVLFAVARFAAARRRRDAFAAFRRATTTSLPLVLSLTLLAPTVVFVSDAAATSGWTYSRQNLSVLAGSNPCGLADDLVVPDPASMLALSPLRPLAGGVPPARRPPVPSVDVFVSGSSGSRVAARSPWYRLPSAGRSVGLYVGGTWRRPEAVRLVWGRSSGGHVTALAARKVKLTAIGTRGGEPAAWRFAVQGILPRRPLRADVLKLEPVRWSGRPATGFLSAPISYMRISLHALIGRRGQIALAAPFLLDTVPCSALPTVRFGLAQPPTMLVDGYTPVADPTGPFGAITDLFQLRRLSLADSRNPPFPVRIFELRLPRGDVPLPVVRTS